MLAIIFGILVTFLILHISKDIFRKNKNAKKLLFKISILLFITTIIVYTLLMKINFLKTAVNTSKWFFCSTNTKNIRKYTN